MRSRVLTGWPGRAAFTYAIAVSALAAASGSPAQAEVPDSAGVVILARQLKNAHLARIGIDGRTLVLKKPAATAAGLGYRSVEVPNGRPALIIDSSSDTVAPLPNPVPWSKIDRMEAGTRSGHAATGAVVGLVGGLAIGGSVAAFAEMGGENDGWQYMIGAAALTTVIGAGIGALFQTTEWTQVHSEPMKVAR